MKVCPSMLIYRFALFFVAIGCSSSVLAQDDLKRELPRTPATAPADAQETFRLHSGFRLLSAASEPLVADPVAACYDADGRLYVVEMRGYPYPEGVVPGGIDIIEDTDGDGRFDRRSEFVGGLSWPTAVVPHEGGVFIAVAPDIIYVKDTDGDGKADIRRVVFSGFGTQNVQGLVNGLIWGPDGWIYGSSGSNGGEIRNLTKPASASIQVRGRDFRFRPEGVGPDAPLTFEAATGGVQFGHSFDDWGRRFVCGNSNHIRQIVLPADALARNPAFLSPAAIADIAADGPAGPVYRISPPEPWRVVRTRQRTADPKFVGRASPSELHAAGFFTSATGVTIYRGSAFPPEFRGNAFIGDVGGNLVHRKTIARSGSILRATRADDQVEFLASTDNWFRPVNFVNTPDGTLLVLDMYRETIEHPASIPEPIKKHLDLTSGHDRGRIYEIIPTGDFRRRPRPALSRASTADLVAHLASPDAWWRESAQRLLVERNDPSAIGPLEEMARLRPSALGRLHAIWTLDILHKLDPGLILEAMADPEPGVREQAARLSEGRADGNPSLRDALLKLADDPDDMVRLRVAMSLGALADPSAIAALADIATRSPADPWIRSAVLCSVGGRPGRLLEALAARSGFTEIPDGRVWLTDLAELVAAEGPLTVAKAMLARFDDATPEVAGAVVLGLGRGLRRSGHSFRSLIEGPESNPFGSMFNRAAQVAGGAGDPRSRVDAIRLLSQGPIDHALKALPPLLDARQPIAVQMAAIQALADLPDGRVGPALIGHWKVLSPSARREVVEALFASTERLAALLDAIESHAMTPTDIDPNRRKELRNHPDATIRARASLIFAAEESSDRARVISAYHAALELAGDPGRGRAVYLKTCATCHRAEGSGAAVGPDLATVSGRNPEDLLTHILDPNREVAANFANYLIVTTDGRTYSGLIAEESAGAVTLKRAEGSTDTIPRARIEEITSTGLSIMPEGMERELTHQATADLITYIRGLAASIPAPASIPADR